MTIAVTVAVGFCPRMARISTNFIREHSCYSWTIGFDTILTVVFLFRFELSFPQEKAGNSHDRYRDADRQRGCIRQAEAFGTGGGKKIGGTYHRHEYGRYQ